MPHFWAKRKFLKMFCIAIFIYLLHLIIVQNFKKIPLSKFQEVVVKAVGFLKVHRANTKLYKILGLIWDKNVPFSQVFHSLLSILFTCGTFTKFQTNPKSGLLDWECTSFWAQVWVKIRLFGTTVSFLRIFIDHIYIYFIYMHKYIFKLSWFSFHMILVLLFTIIIPILYICIFVYRVITCQIKTKNTKRQT